MEKTNHKFKIGQKVIVIGANYSDIITELFASGRYGLKNSGPWLESDLQRMSNSFQDAVKAGKVKHVPAHSTFTEKEGELYYTPFEFPGKLDCFRVYDSLQEFPENEIHNMCYQFAQFCFYAGIAEIEQNEFLIDNPKLKGKLRVNHNTFHGSIVQYFPEGEHSPNYTIPHNWEGLLKYLKMGISL